MQTFHETAQIPIGAQVLTRGVSYRLWAPDVRSAEVVVEGSGTPHNLALDRDSEGFWGVIDPKGRAGDLYRYRLDQKSLLPDIVSRFQPEGVNGRSECIDPTSYGWQARGWVRPGWKGQTTYEIHVGTFTGPGTFQAAIPKLGLMRDLGVEAIELMPLADFEGGRNWGYDGVALYAPTRCYGRPDDLRALVDAAHTCGLAVILDVVYNHVGAQADYFESYCTDFFGKGPHSPWGRSFNLDGPRSGPVRDFLKANVAYWLDEFRFDGLRLDATHAIADSSPRHLIGEIVEIAHARGAFVLAEDERNTTRILRQPHGRGDGVDAVWADDFHHQVRVALTGIQSSYFSAYKGTADAIADTLDNGWSYRGQPFSPWQGKPRGEETADQPPSAFVYCIENHDQVGNRPLGERLEHLVDLRRFRAASMLLCLSPYPALLFMGQEWAATSPFRFFSNHGGALGRTISEGRRRELGYGRESPDPEDRESFERSKLIWEEREEGFHSAVVSLYVTCLRERQILRDRSFTRESVRVRSMGPWFSVQYLNARPQRMLLGTFHGVRLPAAELPAEMAAPDGSRWAVQLDSEAAAFGGQGAQQSERWTLDGPGVLWLAAAAKEGVDVPH